MIQIKCKTGYSLPLKDFRLYSGKLKKHSILEIERVVDSIINDGFLFPISVMKIEDKNYIVDGEATLGNVLFASTFLTTDIIRENYGQEQAKKSTII